MTLERELIDIFAATPCQRNREILIGYHGWADGRRHTLTEIGARFGITRERVRQVCAKLTKRPDIADVPAPTMDRVLALIADRLPCPAARIEADLLEQGLTSVGLSIENLMAAAQLLARPTPFEIVAVRASSSAEAFDSRLVVAPEHVAAVSAIVDYAKKEAYFHGLSTVERIERSISPRSKRAKKCGVAGRRRGSSDTARATGYSRLVRETLPLVEGFCWLDEPAGWFRLDPIHRHGLPKAIDKALAVAGEVTAVQLRGALGRNRRLWKTPPPENVLLEFCRRMPGVRVEGERIVSDPPRDWRNSLTGVEARLVAMLLEHGPVMERGEMEDLCVAGGMNRFSFHAFVSWSPVIAQFGHSVYGLLGATVSEREVKELLKRRSAGRVNHRVLEGHGRTDDGRVWLSYRLSKAASTYAVITIPAALKGTVNGRFQFLDAEGRAIGALATKDGRAWGLGAFLRKHGAQIGDSIVLTLDLENRTASVTWPERDAKFAAAVYSER